MQKEQTYRTDLPAEVAKELRAAAEDCGMTIKAAFRALLEPPDEDEWEEYLRLRITLGQEESQRFDPADFETLTVGIPLPHRQALRLASKTLWVQYRAAGRLILIGFAGKIHQRLAQFGADRRAIG